MIKYIHKLQNLSSYFLSFEVEHIPYEQNFKEDLLSKLATAKITRFNRTDIQKSLASLSIEAYETYSLELVLKSSCMSHIMHYLQFGELPSDEVEARNIKRKTAKPTLLFAKLYKMGEITCCTPIFNP